MSLRGVATLSACVLGLSGMFAAGGSPDPVEGAHRMAAAAPGAAAQASRTDAPRIAEAAPTGSVAGTVSVRMPPPRRSAARYGRTPRAARTVQELPVLVWVRGPLAAASGQRSAGPFEMVQRDTLFAPGALIVPVGATVRFPNEDEFFHNVFSYSDPGRFDLGRYPRGESKSVTFERPGVVKVYCEVHEPMRAVVVVTENPFHARVGADGAFRIDGLPAGTHTLVIWHADLGEVERSVRVVDGGVTRVEVDLG